MESGFGILANCVDVDFVNTGCGVFVSIQQTEREITSITRYELNSTSAPFKCVLHCRDDGDPVDRESDQAVWECDVSLDQFDHESKFLKYPQKLR